MLDVRRLVHTDHADQVTVDVADSHGGSGGGVPVTITAQRAAAHEALEGAVHQMLAAYGAFDEGQMVVGYVLVVGGARLMNADLDDGFDADDGDEDELVSSMRAFARRGQQPIVTRGLVENYLDRWRQP